jgi:hypothetical protein
MHNRHGPVGGWSAIVQIARSLRCTSKRRRSADSLVREFLVSSITLGGQGCPPSVRLRPRTLEDTMKRIRLRGKASQN